MTDRVFVDTNIFVYADDRAATTKQVRARTVLSELVRTRRAVVSTQVMQEYFAAAIKKLGLPPEGPGSGSNASIAWTSSSSGRN